MGILRKKPCHKFGRNVSRIYANRPSILFSIKIKSFQFLYSLYNQRFVETTSGPAIGLRRLQLAFRQPFSTLSEPARPQRPRCAMYVTDPKSARSVKSRMTNYCST
jgi:hypothetical protein